MNTYITLNLPQFLILITFSYFMGWIPCWIVYGRKPKTSKEE